MAPQQLFTCSVHPELAALDRLFLYRHWSPDCDLFPRLADFVGSSNLVRGRLRPDLSRDGLITLETSDGQMLHGVACGRTAGPEPTMSVRTVHLRLHAARPPGDLNVWPVRVRRAVFLGDLTQLHVIWGDRELVVRQTRCEFVEGQPAFLSADPACCVLLDSDAPA